MIFVNGEYAKRVIDTIKQDEDTLWIRAKFYDHGKLIETHEMKGTTFSSMQRPWKKVFGLALLPMPRYRIEGIRKKHLFSIKHKAGQDSIFYGPVSDADSIVVNNKTVWTNPREFIRFGHQAICGLKEIPYKEERKKKRNKQRKK